MQQTCFILIIITFIILTNDVNPLDQPPMYHDAIILFGLAIKWSVLWNAVVNPMASLSIPITCGLSDTCSLGRIEEICSVFIEVGDKVVHQLPFVAYRSVDSLSVHSGGFLLHLTVQNRPLSLYFDILVRPK